MRAYLVLFRPTRRRTSRLARSHAVLLFLFWLSPIPPFFMSLSCFARLSLSLYLLCISLSLYLSLSLSISLSLYISLCLSFSIPLSLSLSLYLSISLYLSLSLYFFLSFFLSFFFVLSLSLSPPPLAIRHSLASLCVNSLREPNANNGLLCRNNRKGVP